MEIPGTDEQVVGVVGGDGEHADSSMSERCRQGSQNPGLCEVERAGDAETRETAVGLYIGRDGGFGANNG